jgi:rRNA small subunit pseudouridine methyltransferase Nep1
MALKKRKASGGGAAVDAETLNKRAKRRKKSVVEKVEGPSAADKLLPRTLEERMAARRIVVVLEKCALECVQPRKGALELLNSDDHHGIASKSGRDVADLRPDITHQCLMALLDSPLNKAGKLLIYLHTSQNVLVEVHPSLRVPRTFKRFAGLCVELLQRNKIRAAQANETLMKVVSNPVEKYLPPGCRRFGFSVSGRAVKFREFAAQLDADNHQNGRAADVPIVFAVGAVARGDPVTEEKFGMGYTEENVSICPWGLSAACCCSKICNEFESLWGIC